MFESRNRPFAPALAAMLTGIALAGCHASSEGPESPPPPRRWRSRSSIKRRRPQGALPVRLLLRDPGRSMDGTLNLPTAAWRSAAMLFGAECAGRLVHERGHRHGLQPADRSGVSISASTVKIIKLWVDPTTKAPATNPGLPADGRTSPVAGVLDLRHRLHRRRVARRRHRRQVPADHAAQATRSQHGPGGERRRSQRRQGPERRLPRGPDQRPQGH